MNLGRARSPFVAVPLLGWAIRFVLVLGTHRPLRGPHDQLVYMIAGKNIALGNGYAQLNGAKTAYYPPGYPYFLGVLQWLGMRVGLDNSLELLSGLAQTVLAAIMILAVMVVAYAVTPTRSKRIATLAGLIVACWPNLIAYSAVMLSEQLYLTLMCVCVAGIAVTATEEWKQHHRVSLVVAGVSFGLAVLVRPQALLLGVFLGIALVIIRRPWKESARLIGVLGISTVLILTPWTIRNYSVFDGFVPLSTNSGDNLCLGFNPDAKGHFAFQPACETVPFYKEGPKAEYTRNIRNTSVAIDWAKNNLSALPALTAWKFRWAYEHDYDGLRALEDYESDPWIPSSIRTGLRWGSNLYLIGVGIAAIAGMLLLIRRRKIARSFGHWGGAVLMVATIANAIVPALFFGDARFKVPAEPFYAILAAIAIDALWSARKKAI